MNYVIILNGFVNNISQQVANVANFVVKYIDHSLNGDVIAFYATDAQKSEIVGNAIGRKLFLIKVNRYHPENFLKILTNHGEKPYDIYLFQEGIIGNELSVRLSCRLGGSALASVDRVSVVPSRIVCRKPVYSGFMAAEIILEKKPFCLSISKGAIDKSYIESTPYSDIIEILKDKHTISDHILEYHLEEKKHTVSLDEIKFIVVGGNGLGSKTKVKQLQQMAEAIDAGFGVSKPVVMNAFIEMSRLIGVSGSIIHPDLCLTVAVSGSPAFFCGIENSQFIVSINSDKYAPIIKKSDVSIIDDYKPVMRELVRLIEKNKR